MTRAWEITTREMTGDDRAAILQDCPGPFTWLYARFATWCADARPAVEPPADLPPDCEWMPPLPKLGERLRVPGYSEQQAIDAAKAAINTFEDALAAVHAKQERDRIRRELSTRYRYERGDG